MIKDMTKGTPWKLIFAFMVPVCCGNIFQNFYNIFPKEEFYYRLFFLTNYDYHL